MGRLEALMSHLSLMSRGSTAATLSSFASTYNSACKLGFVTASIAVNLYKLYDLCHDFRDSISVPQSPGGHAGCGPA